MKVGVFLKIKSVLSIFSGLCQLLAGNVLLPLYGVTLDRAGTLFLHWTGSFLLGIGLICWFASKAEKSDLRQGVLLSLFICDSVGFVAALMAQLAGVSNVLGWFNVALFLVLALGLGWYRFLAKE